MVYGCGNKCVKYLVFLFNFLVFVVGAVVLGVSLAIRYSNDVQKYFQKILDSSHSSQSPSTVSLDQMYIPLYVLMGIGALLLLTGFLGCCGACCENSCLLALFFSIILILFIAELACGIAILVNKNSFKKTIEDAITPVVQKYSDPSTSADTKNAIDQMQQDFKCCGCKNATDYLTPPKPASCYKDKEQIPPNLFTTGCCEKIWNEAESQLAIVGGVAIGILVIELLAMIFSCILCQAFRRGDYQYA